MYIELCAKISLDDKGGEKVKEAAGEANMTVLVIVLIAIVAAVATPLITNLMNNVERKSCCTDAGGTWRNNQCEDGGNTYYDAATYNACLNDAE